jgi:hypothetical protein
MRGLIVMLVLFATPSLAHAATTGLFDTPNVQIAAAGWRGFLDTKFMIESLGALTLAILLGAVIGYHPTTPRTVDKLHEVELPKVYIMYAFIGAVIGVTVREFGMVIGVVVFGIGGLIRFRTDAGSTRDTGRLIAVTLAGLIAGLGLPHFAVITAAFTFGLIYLFDARPACRVKIGALPAGRVAECTEIYRAVLQGHGCRIITEHNPIGKDRIEFVFRMPRHTTRNGLHTALCDVPLDVRGEIDWEVE